MSNLNNHFVICSCESADHTLRFVSDNEDTWVEVQLCQTKNFLSRIIAATKYIFGYQCRYGHWDCTSLSREEEKKLLKYLQKVNNDRTIGVDK